jgi:DNA repair exonuclease SbcCD nuclease subunit
MIKKVIHTADWHLEPKKNHEKFNDAIDSFISTVQLHTKDCTPEEVLIVIVGDLFDNTSKEPSNEAFIIMFDALHKISSHWKTVISIGNHDYDIRNPEKMDYITPLYNAFVKLGWRNIKYMKSTEDYEIENLIFSNFSNHDRGIPNPPKSNKTKIALFHDPIMGAINFEGYDLTEGHNRYDVSIFEGFDIVMMGDIHRHQQIPYEIPVVYSGSLFQVNSGESVNGHGFVMWDLDNYTYKFIEVEINHGIYKITSDTFQDVISGNFKIKNLK